MSKNVRFSLFLGVLLVASLGLKLAVGGGLVVESNAEIARSLEEPLARQNVNSAGVVTYAGFDTLLVEKNGCMMYLVPVVPHGWNQASLRRFKPDDQALWFVADGEIVRDYQPRVRPLARYFAAKALRYMGIDFGYYPVIAVLGAEDCQPASIDWSTVPLAHFKAKSLF